MSNASSKKETLEILQKRKKLITAFINNRNFSDDAVVNERQKDKKECAMYLMVSTFG